MASRHEFQPYSAFLRIERTGQRAVSANCIHEFLIGNGIRNFAVRDVELLLKYFDIGGDGMLSYTEFNQMILPCDDLNLRSEAS